MAAAIVLIVVVGGVTGWYFYLRQSTKIEPASMEKMAYPLPDKPSIAVLPFDNLSGIPDQDYLADGITENIITALSYIPEIFVIARNSTFTYKGKAVKAQKVAEDLGVRYILEGSVQRAGDRLRITAQLIDATTGRHLWADRYDRDLQDLFALQDEITLKIVFALEVKLSVGVQTRLARKTMPNFEAWSYYVRGYGHMKQHTKDDNAKARELFERAANLDRDMPRLLLRLVGRIGKTRSMDGARLGESLSSELLNLRKRPRPWTTPTLGSMPCGELSTYGKGGMTKPLPKERSPSPSVPTSLSLTFCWGRTCTTSAGTRRHSRL